jgi:hypothetical protein
MAANGTSAALPAGAQTIEILNDPVALARATPDQLEQAIDRRNALMDKIRDAAVKATWSEQWTNMDGKPWPTAAAAETIARRCAVKVHSVSYKREERHDDQGGFFFYAYTGTVELPGGLDSAEVVGTCSSRDQFIGTGTGDGADDLSEINEDDILKAAYSNMIVNGVMRLLGLRGLTWARLSELSGGKLESEKAAQITHKGGARGGGQGQTANDVVLKFGRSKDKKLSECSDEDVRWYIGRWEADLADAAKEKFHKFCKRDIEIGRAILAARANAQAGTTAGAPAADQKPSPWQRIRALDRQMPEDELKAITKKATGKANASQLADADVDLVAKAIVAHRQAGGDDIPF